MSEHPNTGTWREMVKAIRPELRISDEDADWVLWEMTSFPLGSPEEIERQARECVRGMRT